MFLPIIHNLPESHPAFKACRHYNRLIASKPKGWEVRRLSETECQDAINTTNALKEGK